MQRRLWSVLLALLLGGVWTPADGANAIKIKPEAALVFRNAGQTSPTTTVTMSLGGIATNTGRISAQQSLGGASVWAPTYLGFCQFQFSGASLTIGDELELYAAPGFLTHVAGQLGTVDAAILTANVGRLQSLWPIATLIINQATVNTPMHFAFDAYIPFNVWSLVVWNRATNDTTNTVSANWCTFTPYFYEVQ